MPSETGIWSEEEAATGHLFSYRVAQYIGELLRNNKSMAVYDFGCGPASYVRYLVDIGYRNVIGVEGTHLERSESGLIVVQDLTKPFDLGRKGHVISLEVAEHIPAQFTDQYLANIANHVGENCFLVLSWAVPGQDGLGHVNCQPNHVVIDLLQKNGFEFLKEKTDTIRGRVENHLAYFKDTLLIFRKE